MMIMGTGVSLLRYGLDERRDEAPAKPTSRSLDVLASMEKPLFGILAGAVFTGLVQVIRGDRRDRHCHGERGIAVTTGGGSHWHLAPISETCATALLAALGKTHRGSGALRSCTFAFQT